MAEGLPRKRRAHHMGLNHGLSGTQLEVLQRMYEGWELTGTGGARPTGQLKKGAVIIVRSGTLWHLLSHGFVEPCAEEPARFELTSMARDIIVQWRKKWMGVVEDPEEKPENLQG